MAFDISFPTAEFNRGSNTRKPMQFKHVTVDFDGPVAILKLDHPEVMNAVSMDMLGGLGEALDAIDGRKTEVRCRRQSAGPRQRQTRRPQQCRCGAGNRVSSVPAPLAKPALPDRDLGER